MDPSTWKRLEPFVRAELGRPLFERPLRLLPTSSLMEDLGVTDFDAIEFINKWAEAFDVDVQDFPRGRYFDFEGIELWPWLFWRRRQPRKRVPLTLEMLAAAMELGTWCTETIESMHPPPNM